MIKVKKSAIGKSIYHKSIGWTTIKEGHVSILKRIGRIEFLEGLPQVKKLRPKSKKNHIKRC